MKKGTDRVAFSKRLSKLAVESDVGLIIGSFLVSRVLESDRKFIEGILTRVSQPFVFLITSYAGENDVMDLFEEQLNPSRGADPSKSSLIGFLKAVWSLSEIESTTVAIWDSAVPSLEGTPWHTITLDQLIERLMNYYDRTSLQFEILTVSKPRFTQSDISA
ncbi:hypothetical protein J2P12_04220 [Candidatus Bathyarchaeota archaeon]|nr:hypothetical protein [Candidatus Bathyarchaeota archaeon]